MQGADPVVFVLGATGYVGSAVVERLAESAHLGAVVAHVRPGSARADLAIARCAALGPKVHVNRAPLEAGPLGDSLERWTPTHLFLCHGTTAKRARSEDLAAPYEAIDVGLTRLLVDAALAQAPEPDLGPRVVHLSSVGASPSSRSPYLAARGRAEGIVRDSGLPFTICRAPLLTGPDRDEHRPGEVWGRRLLDPLLLALGAIGLGDLRDRYRSMDASECAAGLVRSGFHYMTINRIVESDELRSVGVYERERWVPASRRDTDRH